MRNVRSQADEVCTVWPDQLVPEGHEEVVPSKAFGGLLQIRDEAADVAVVPPTFGDELLPQAVLGKPEQLVLR